MAGRYRSSRFGQARLPNVISRITQEVQIGSLITMKYDPASEADVLNDMRIAERTGSIEIKTSPINAQLLFEVKSLNDPNDLASLLLWATEWTLSNQAPNIAQGPKSQWLFAMRNHTV